MMNAEILMLVIGVFGRALLITAAAGTIALIARAFLPKKMRERIFK